MRRRTGPEPTGGAVLTAGFHLPASAVIHTVEPILQGVPTEEHARLLASCYRSALDVAAERSYSTIGLCSVSTGVFGYPKDDAAQVVLATLDAWFAAHPDVPLRAVVSLFADVDVAAYERALLERAA